MQRAITTSSPKVPTPLTSHPPTSTLTRSTDSSTSSTNTANTLLSSSLPHVQIVRAPSPSTPKASTVTIASVQKQSTPVQPIHPFINGKIYDGFPLSTGNHTISWIARADVKSATPEQKAQWAEANKRAAEHYIKALISMYPQQATQLQKIYEQQKKAAKEALRKTNQAAAPQPTGQASVSETNVEKLLEILNQLGIKPQDFEKLNLSQYFQTATGDSIYYKEEDPASFVWGKDSQYLDKSTAQELNETAKDVFADLLKTLKPRATVVQFFKTYTNKGNLFGLLDIYAIAKELQLEISKLGKFAAPFSELPILAEDGVAIDWITEEQARTASPEQKAKWAKANKSALRNLKKALEQAFPDKSESLRKSFPATHEKEPYFSRFEILRTIYEAGIKRDCKLPSPVQTTTTSTSEDASRKRKTPGGDATTSANPLPVPTSTIRIQ